MVKDPETGASIGDTADNGNDLPEPASLKFLRLLVTVLTGVMIVGMVVLVALFLSRYSSSPSVSVPDTLQLPDGVQATAITFGPGWTAIVTDDNTILIYDADSGSLRQTVTIEGSD